MENPIKINDLGVPLFWKHPDVGVGGSFSSRNQRSRGLGIARVRGRRGGRDAPEAPPLVIAEADAALSAQRLRSDTAVKRGVRGGNLPKVALNWGERWGKSKV